ncbi:hypothetical protein [Streptosporangium carneum]|uniref:Uncharacterized protein n=1 Tax=Streptosporangium carneum TaxID=47481 RepID=A0A9W6MA04_9ACTN|nr:hypothetical protein [Streptosporangium carneum]GLK06789.1 hypothetical protein GCM10017600_01940 [Streptosporangium carneum]
MRPPISEDRDLDWDLGPPPRNNRRMVIVVISMVGAILLAVGVWRLMGSGSDDPRSVSTAQVADTRVALAPPSGYESEAGYPVGFPRTELGAASAAAAALEAAWTLDVAQAEHAAVLYAPPDQREVARAGARASVAGWRETLGLPKTGALPPGAAMRTKTIGIQWRPRSKDLVQVSVLVQVTATKGVGDTDPTYSSPYAMNLLMTWNPTMRGPSQGDWVNIPDPAPAAVPRVAPPGTPEFTAAGWKPLSGPDPTP